MSLVILLSSQSAGQTIVCNAPTPATQVFAPAVTVGAQIVVVGAPFSSTTVFNPTVTPGSVTIITSAPSPSTVVYEPRVTDGTGTQTIVTAAPVPSTQVFTPVGIIKRQFIGYPGPVATDPQLMPYRKIKEPKRVNYRAIKRKRKERREEEAMILFFMELFDESEDTNANL